MGLYDHWPYTNFHELNLTWLLRRMEYLSNVVENFVALNTIKYADPIQWNITSQYETNTVVVDPQTGTAYISSRPVPAGVALNNTDYWSVIFTLDMISANDNITLRDDGANVLSTFASNEGDWLLWNGNLYRVSQNINLNEAYVVGYNLTRYTVELFIKDYISELTTIIGDLDNLTTADKDSLVNAINEINSNMGDISTLTTTDKSSTVNAINEIVSGLTDTVEQLNNLKIFNVLDYGAVGDGVTDDTTAFRSAIAAAKTAGGGIIYVPYSSNGYIISDTLTLDGNIYVVGCGFSVIKFSSATLFSCSGIYGGIKNVHAISNTELGTFIDCDCTTTAMYRWRFEHLIAESCTHTMNQRVVALADVSNSYMFECEFNDILSFRTNGDVFVSMRSRGFLMFNDINIDNTYRTTIFPYTGIYCEDFIGVHLTDCNYYGPTSTWVPTPTYTSNQWAIRLIGRSGGNSTVFITRCMSDTTFGNGIYIGYCQYIHILGIKSFNTWGRGILLDHVEHLDGTNFYINGAKAVTDVAVPDDNSGLVMNTCNFVDITNIEAYNFKGYGVSEYNCNNVHISNAQIYDNDTCGYRELDDGNGGMKSNIIGNVGMYGNTVSIIQQSSNAVVFNYSIGGTMTARTEGAFSI